MPLRDKSGKVVKWYGTNVDIEDRKRAEARISQAETDLRLAMDTIPAVVWSAGPDGSADFVSRGWLEYTNLSLEETKGSGWSLAIHPDDRSKFVDKFLKAIAEGTPYEDEGRSALHGHARHGAEHGVATGSITVDMTTVRRRKREMVERQIAAHLQQYKASGAELIMGSGRFIAPKTVEVILNEGGTRVLTGDKVFLDIGTHAAIPNVPGLDAAKPLTHVEVLELDYLPQHLIVIGGGYSGLELAQAYRRFGSDVTIIESGPQLMGREEIDVSREMRRVLSDDGIRVLLEAQLLEVRGRSGDKVTLVVRTPSGEQNIDGSDILVAVGRVPNTAGIGLQEAGVELDSRGYRGKWPAGDECARRVGSRGMRRQPTIHAHIRRRFSDRT